MSPGAALGAARSTELRGRFGLPPEGLVLAAFGDVLAAFLFCLVQAQVLEQ